MAQGISSHLTRETKWLVSRRNFYIGDNFYVVLLKEDANSNEWKLAKVINVYPEEKGHVRNVQLYLGTSDPSKLLSLVLVRPTD